MKYTGNSAFLAQPGGHTIDFTVSDSPSNFGLPYIIAPQSSFSPIGLLSDNNKLLEQTSPIIFTSPKLNFNNLDSDIPRPNPSLLAPAIIAGEFNILPVSILLTRNSPIAGDL